ncbi:fasciclin domain-containing protein [Spirosoma utsteinense]|uniref:Surface protein n=1 Tax=Spirosoma utsteinense TaxID=2585773 RepID=A0ABR6W8E8_9BACT|nr:fasciclin domain-containing protein [Spirosoma utsteinense]MBC3787887.1 putative surface protein [Spirosoma utsteinense]MBC3792192.1 putative surface protein [Spirosoma utsteinense]
MKINQTLSLLTFGLALIGLDSYAQTTPTGAATSTTYPVGAVTVDSANTVKPSRAQRRAARGNRSKTARPNAGNTGATSQDGQYRQSSAAQGTSVNNSNATNYNSNNVTNAATGVGSNPSVTTQPTTLSGSSGTSATTSSSSSAGSDATKTGTAAAVTGARTETKTPADVAGSTERTTSIHDFISSSPNYVTLQNALQSTDLDEKLKAGTAYTLFAPTNAAFKKLPATVQAGLLEGRNREALTQLMSYHLVAGTLDAKALTQQIKAGNGKATLTTVAGGVLTAQLGAGGQLTITDEQGKSATVEDSDKIQSNGIVHGLNAVLMPKNAVNSIR